MQAQAEHIEEELKVPGTAEKCAAVTVYDTHEEAEKAIPGIGPLLAAGPLVTLEPRPRPDPTERFAAPEHFIDLRRVKTNLLTEPLSAEHGHRHETIYKTRTLTIATFVFEKDAALQEHVTKGVVMIQVVSGRIAVKTHSRTYEMSPGEVLVLAPNVQHSVTAYEPSQMLLTVDLAV